MTKKNNNNDNGVLLLMLGLLVIMAACPPIGVVLVLCIVFSDGTVSGFVGCLTPFIVLVLVALMSMAFSQNDNYPIMHHIDLIY